MPPFVHHVLVCMQQKVEDKPYCTDHGSEEILQELHRQIRARGLQQHVLVTPCGCLGLCRQGPNMVIYPAGTWYSQVATGDIKEIVVSHLEGGEPVARLCQQAPEDIRRDILACQRNTLAREQAHEEAGALPESVRKLASDFWASRALLTAVELDLFTALGEDGCAVAEAADRMGTDSRATRMLLDALCALGLLTKSGDQYANTPETGRYLQRGQPDDAWAAVMNRVNMWDRWSTLTECVREGSSMGLSNHTGPSSTQAYIAATHKIAALAAPALVASLEIPTVRRVLDVGGGSGAYTVAVLRANEGATAEIMDLPPVARLATRYIREAGMEDRISLRPADFTAAPLGTGFDLVLLSYVMHLNSAEVNKRLLARAFNALEPGGTLVINDYVLQAEKTLPRHAALYALNMLVTTHNGGVYSLQEYDQWLAGAGFSDVRKVSLLGPTDVVTARKV